MHLCLFSPDHLPVFLPLSQNIFGLRRIKNWFREFTLLTYKYSTTGTGMQGGGCGEGTLLAVTRVQNYLDTSI